MCIRDSQELDVDIREAGGEHVRNKVEHRVDLALVRVDLSEGAHTVAGPDLPAVVCRGVGHAIPPFLLRQSILPHFRRRLREAQLDPRDEAAP